MAEEKKDTPEVTAAPVAAGPNPKMLMGILGLNLVVMLAVVAVLFISQKKADKQVDIEKIADGSAEGGHGAPAAGGHGAPAAGGHGAPAAGAEAEDKNSARFFNVGEFTANLNSIGNSRYVKVNINFELDTEMKEDEMKKRSAQIRDRVITILNSKRPEDLQKEEGRGFLKEEIKTAINEFLQSGKVLGVYFSTFVFD